VSVTSAGHSEGRDATVRAAIEERSRTFAEAYNRGDIDAVAAMYTEDAIAFPPDAAVVKGRAALHDLWKSSRDGGVTKVTLLTETVEGAGDLAIETGSGELQVRDAGGASGVQRMKFVVVWCRGSDGVWRLHRDIWNGLPAGQ
jgi:ketosteroid isomerase-like protein